MGAAVSFERRQRGQAVFIGAIVALAASNVLMAVGGGQTAALIGALVVFFSAFNILEASLPSLVSKAAPAEAKGTALGVYSSLQFLGIFAGGAAGGWLNQHAGSGGVFAFTIVLALLWLVGAVALRPARVS
jgi:predicted MFS family arabinose efflux permease